MARPINPVSNNESFEQWVAVTNTMADAFQFTLTSALTANGDSVNGNSYVNGHFGAVTITANTLRGGTITDSANLTITSNVIITSSNNVINSNNINLISGNLVLKSNTVIPNITILGNGTTSNVTLSGNVITLVSNTIVSGRLFRLPSGNNANRPAGANGAIRYNEDSGNLEYYNNSDWLLITATSNGVVGAGLINFIPNANITSNNVQSAINEVYNKKLNTSGDISIGKFGINFNVTPPQNDITGTLLQLTGQDGINTGILLDSFANTGVINARRANGLNGTLSALSNNDVILNISGLGYSNTYSTSRASISYVSTQDWTSAAQGTQIHFKTTANGSTTEVLSLVIGVNKSTFSANLDVVGSISANTLSGNGASITSLHGNNVSTGIINANRLGSGANNTTFLRGDNSWVPIVDASQSTPGVIAIASSSDYLSGNIANKALTPTTVWTSANVVIFSDSGTYVLDMSTFINGQITLIGNRNMGTPTNMKVGQSGFIRIIQDNIGGRTLTFNSTWKWSGGITPTLTSTGNSMDILFYQVISANTILGSLVEDVK